MAYFHEISELEKKLQLPGNFKAVIYGYQANDYVGTLVSDFETKKKEKTLSINAQDYFSSFDRDNFKDSLARFQKDIVSQKGEYDTLVVLNFDYYIDAISSFDPKGLNIQFKHDIELTFTGNTLFTISEVFPDDKISSANTLLPAIDHAINNSAIYRLNPPEGITYKSDIRTVEGLLFSEKCLPELEKLILKKLEKFKSLKTEEYNAGKRPEEDLQKIGNLIYELVNGNTENAPRWKYFEFSDFFKDMGQVKGVSKISAAGAAICTGIFVSGNGISQETIFPSIYYGIAGFAFPFLSSFISSLIYSFTNVSTYTDYSVITAPNMELEALFPKMAKETIVNSLEHYTDMRGPVKNGYASALIEKVADSFRVVDSIRATLIHDELSRLNAVYESACSKLGHSPIPEIFNLTWSMPRSMRKEDIVFTYLKLSDSLNPEAETYQRFFDKKPIFLSK